MAKKINSCARTCILGCNDGCYDTCEQICKDSCNNGCKSSCTSMCQDGCKNICGNKCSRNCVGDVDGRTKEEREPENTCAGACSQTCFGGCLDKCYQSCKDSCSGGSESNENKLEGEEENMSTSSQGKNCGGGCAGQCGKECASSCSFSCDDGCYSSSTNERPGTSTTNCKNQCAGSCYTSCAGYCKETGEYEPQFDDEDKNGIPDPYEPAQGTAHLTGQIPEHRGCGVCTSSCSLGCGNSNNQEDERIEELAQSFNCDSCQGSCVQQCSNCEGTCEGGCYNSCSYLCNKGCEDESKTIPKIKSVMDANNVKEIFEFLIQEAERRNFVSETDWEDTIRMIALTAQIGQTFIDEEAVWDSIWDTGKWMITSEEMQRLASVRQQKINKNQINYHSLTDDSIITSSQLMELLIMPTDDNNAEQTVRHNKSKRALLNDILFNRTTLTVKNYQEAKNGSYKSILEQEGRTYLLDFLMPKTNEIYSLLMILYIAYNGQKGFNDRIFQILSSERIRIYGNDTSLLSNSQIIDLLTLKKTDSNTVKRNKQILISEFLYYQFAPQLLTFESAYSLGMAKTKGNDDIYYNIYITNQENKKEKYTFPELFKNPTDGFIHRLSHYYYYVSGSRITDMFRPNGLINEPRSSSIKAIEDKIKELEKEGTNKHAAEINTLKTRLANDLTIQQFQSDKEKFDWIQDYNNSTRRKHKGELKEIVLSKILLNEIQSIEYHLSSNNLELNKLNDPTTNPYFISLENSQTILEDPNNINNNQQIKDKLYDLQKIAYRMLLYYFQYGGFYFEGQKIENLASAYPYYIELKNSYDNGMKSILGTGDGTVSNLGNLTTDAQKEYIKNFYYTSANALEAFFDSSSSSVLYTILITGTNQINYRSSNWQLKGMRRFGFPINQMLFENMHIEDQYRDKLKNPPHDLNKMPPYGGRTGFQYEIYSVIMMALVREHGQIIMYAEEKENQINPNRELFKLVADERIKILNEKEFNKNFAYDSNLKYSKLLHHNVELTENQKSAVTWDGYMSFDPQDGSGIPHRFSVTSAYADPDWRRLDFNTLGSYPASTEAVINALNYDFYRTVKDESGKEIFTPEYGHITDKDLLGYNKNRLFTDIYCSNFEKINLFTGTPPYCMSTNNVNTILAIKKYDYRNNSDIVNEEKAKEQFIKKMEENSFNPIYKEIVYIQYKYDGKVDASFYLIYDSNGTNFEWQNYTLPNNIQFNNLFTSKLIGKTMTVPYQFDKQGQIGYLSQEIKYIPDSYKETIESLDNYGEGTNYIIKNEVPMIIEDILVNVFNKDLNNNYQSGTLSQNLTSKIITKTLTENYNGNNQITKTQYNILSNAGVNMGKYFEESGTDSAGNPLYTMKKSITLENNNTLNTREEVFKHFYETYHKNAYTIDRMTINNLTEFEINEKRNESAKIFSFYSSKTEKGSSQWEEIATALRDEYITVNETNATSSVT